MSDGQSTSTPSLLLRALSAGVCAPFWISGIDKLLDLNAASREMLDSGMPHPDLMAIVVVTVQLGGSALTIVSRGLWAELGAVGLALFTVMATTIAHAFWTFHGPERIGQMNVFFEHVSIVFGLLTIAWAQARVRLDGQARPGATTRLSTTAPSPRTERSS